jgi:hypothetical protein
VQEVGSGSWRDWLAATDSSGFRFDAVAGRFTARRETRRNAAYWYAYRKSAGTLRKVYLGRTADLTRERLDAAAAALRVGPDHPRTRLRSRARCPSIGLLLSVVPTTSRTWRA